MKKKILLSILMITLCFAMAAGCGKKEEADKKETTKTETTKKTKEPEKEEVLKTIGEEKDATFKVKLSNSMGQDITAISVKNSNDQAYPENMLKNTDKFAKDETRMIYYKSTAAKEAATETGKVLPLEYSIQVTLADGTISELHAFPFEDIEEGKINVQDKMAYITYQSIASKQEISTLDAEKAVKAQAEAAVQAQKAADEAAAKAAADAAAQAASQAAQAPAQTEYVAPAEPQVQEPAPEPVQPDTGAGDTTAEDGCLNDGLTY